MKRVVGFLCLAAAALALFAARPGGQSRATAPLPGLAALFDPARGATRDTNGDGIPDTVAARVIVPAPPSTEDVQAAATIAARLGHETMALTLPIVLRDAEVEGASGIDLPILVGRENRFVKALVERGDVDLKVLAPGQGLVAVVRSPLGGADGIVAVGGDDAGTLNAAMELGARLPRLWSMAGVAIAGIEEQARRYLVAQGLSGHEATLVSVVVDSDRRGLLRATVRVPATGVNAPLVVRAFEALDLAHRRGLEPRVLNFANMAATRMEVVVAGTIAGQVDVRRSGFNPRTLTPPLDTEEEAAVERQRVARAAAQAAKPPDAPESAGAQAAAAETKPPAQAVPPAGAVPPARKPPAAPTGALAAAAPAPGTAAPGGAQAGPPAPAKTFDLSNAYSIDGWFGDSYTDLIPDRTETVLVVPQGDEGLGAAHIAARLGLAGEFPAPDVVLLRRP